MSFYAYIPCPDGSEPLGTANRVVFERKTFLGALAYARRYLKTHSIKLFYFKSIFDASTFIQLSGPKS